MNIKELFYEQYLALCSNHGAQPSHVDSNIMLKLLKNEIKDDELILKALQEANTSKHKFIRTSTDSQGHTCEVPRMPTGKEIARICHDLKESFFQEKAERESLLMLSQPKEISEQAKANGELACALAMWFGCCPDRVYSLIDSGTLKADLSLASHNFFKYFGKDNIHNQKRPVAIRNFIQSTYADVIEICKK